MAHAAALARLRVDNRLGFASPVFRYSGDGSRVLLTGRLGAQFRAGTSALEIRELTQSNGLTILREPALDSGRTHYLFEVPRDGDALELARLLSAHPAIEWAGPDMVAGRARHSEPFFANQYYLRNNNVLNGVRVDINVEPAWQATVGVWEVGVIVIDDGIDGAQTDVWCGLPVLWAYDAFLNQYPDTPTNPHVNDTHGTAVAGIINGCHNGAGIAGIAPGISIGIHRIFRNDDAASDAAIADAINHAWATSGGEVLSNSWGGGPPNSLITGAINNATTQGRGGKGAIVVFSAGNTSKRDGISTVCNQPVCGLNYPATLSNVIAVGAINRDGALTNYTPEGPQLDIVAPSSHFTGSCGGDVVTTDRVGLIGCNDGPNQNENYTSSFGGTSAAAPQVAGAAALLLTIVPNYTRTQITNLLLNNADRGGTWATTTQFGQGKLNVGRAMAQLVPPPPPLLSASISGPSAITAKGTYTWSANPSGGTGVYSYQWSVYFHSSGTTQQLGTAQSQQRFVQPGDGTFDMRVTVTSGSQSLPVSQTVVECIGQPGGCYDP